ncbi:PadR family transcriptional regulator [Diaminobutyricimonas sp. LJ205]|uniref:PadR family transcriptional regulator n=1 Tax=Diaminobutyricimonas sp. LJ205 TaxID=2683590 RepID=UPI0012F50DB2|nr:PadR family transcriptional regulator [Diaminobutyricimonas sp. LJ205]
MKHAILGLLDLAPMTGYDLKKNFDATIAHFWAGDQAQIYRTLTALVQSGLAEVSVVEQTGKPNRNVHRLTEAGRAELERWLRSPLEQDSPREPFLARLFFAGRLDDDAVRHLIAERRERAQAELQILTSMRDREPAASDLAHRLRLATLDNGIAHTTTEISWLTDLESTL